MNKNIKRNNDAKQLLDRQNRLLYESDFVIKYEPRFKSKTFWLGGKTKKQLEPIMEEYLNDFRNAYGYTPSWYVNEWNGSANKYSNLRINIQSFLDIMKQEWRINQ